ncbi:hypothetical protein MDOR_04250 [Mycolicibacterium doricum]|uniref:Uncharacterized protein n=1 Tax=Mycolicibacterium doricum TaxID=126673 RepID=A0A1X1T103_9MYCO|nr:hypothetical protein [Mycolicibacterium doricum]MCV7269246.1 hypothetical protein [Mycolicibacterium doricum]ORV37940.1 hypothetical protein AWC01_14940 [Mycolicibacterium doricum]BBZ06256.1 hypothetical protein MDOR_04250 [Mycolicibacterium doricum]
MALEPILLKSQLPMAMNMREESRRHGTDDGIDRPVFAFLGSAELDSSWNCSEVVICCAAKSPIASKRVLRL